MTAWPKPGGGTGQAFQRTGLHKRGVLSCSDTFSCSADLCVALPSVANAATTPAGAMGDDISGCFIDKETGPGCGDTPACASAVCVAGPPLVPGGPGCEITEIGNFCACASVPCTYPAYGSSTLYRIRI